MLKKILLAVAAIGVSSAALAHDGWDRDRDRDRHHERRVERLHQERPRVVERAPVVYRQPGVSVSVNLPW